MFKYLFCLFIALSASLFSFDLTPKEQELVNQVDSIIKHPHDAVWPSLNLADTPIILAFPNEKLIAFHLKTNNPNWQLLDPERPYILAAAKDLWGVSRVMLHPSFPLEGQKVFVFTVQENSKNPIHVMAHEWFHRYQMDRFAPDQTYARQYQDQLNLTNLILMRLEEHILLQFLQKEDNDPAKKEILKDFVAVNKIRKSIIHPESWVWELNQQKIEGLADYISIRLFHREEELLHSFKQSNDHELIEKAIKWRHYNIGASLAIALDYLNVQEWKQEVEQKGMSQATLLESALPLNEDLFERFEWIKMRYPFQEIATQISSHLGAYQKEIDHWLTTYEKTPGTVIRLGPPRVGISGGGNSGHIFTLQNGTIFSIMDCSRSLTSDNLWQIETKKVPVYFQCKQGFREFKVEGEGKITINGIPYSLKEIEERKQDFVFHSLEIEGEQISFNSREHKGVISTEEGILLIRYI